MDRLLGILLLGLTFLLASFAATNSEVWMHLASGRIIAEGNWQYGVDPFSSTVEAVPWYNPHWLYSLTLYKGYQWLGGAGLVVVKALLAVLTIACLLQIRPTGFSRLAVMISTLLVALAITPRMQLAPNVISLFFLSVTLLLLFRGGALTDGGANKDAEGGTTNDAASNARLLWRIPLLFILWANLDSWVILGPLTILLLWAGAGLARLMGQKNSVAGRTLGLLFAASLAACMVNPHHFHIFQLPGELAYLLIKTTSPLGLTLPDFLVAGGKTLHELQRFDPQMTVLISPFNSNFFSSPIAGANIAGWCYFMLLGLGLASFLPIAVLGGPARFPIKSFLIWVFFALCSANLFRMLPFFGIVAGPVMVMNLAELPNVWASAGKFHRARGWGNAGLIRALIIPVLLALFFLAWPGWISGPMNEFTFQTSASSEKAIARHVAWTVSENPSLWQTALRLGELQKAGQVRRVFNFTLDLADYCAWFAPDVKCCIDFRFPLFAGSAAAYGKTKKVLLTLAPEIAEREPEERDSWERGLRESWAAGLDGLQADHLAITSTPLKTTLDPPNRWLVEFLWRRYLEWEQRYGDGRSALFFWNKSLEAPKASYDWWEGMDKKAFGTVALDQRPPAEGTTLPVGEVAWWDKYRDGLSPPRLDASEAQLLWHYFLAAPKKWFGPTLALSQLAVWNAASGLCGAAPGTALGLSALGMTRNTNWLFLLNIQKRQGDNPQEFVRGVDLGPPALPILMVRHARRAVAESPHDARGYLRLYDACATLWQRQENNWTRLPNPGGLRDKLREVQTVTALKTYLDLNPEDAEKHYLLSQLYLRLNYLDLARDHLALTVKHQRVNAPDAEGKTQLKELLLRLENEVEGRRRDFELMAGNLNPLEKAFKLLQPFRTVDENNKERIDPNGVGLALLRLQYLQEIKPEAAPPQQQAVVSAFQIELLLQMGRAAEVEEALGDEKFRSILGPLYARLRLMQAAAKGDYALMEESLVEQEKTVSFNQIQAWATLSTINHLALNSIPPAHPGARGNQLWFIAILEREGLPTQHGVIGKWTKSALTELVKLADLRCLRGIVALEVGDTAKACGLFEEALQIAPRFLDWPDRAVAARYLYFLKEQQK
ncbi:MAG: hypothetical protein HY040_12550 [Planctomycetes bacterium]|nr:hypothetical protein [Planctomycetota bacterium]